MNSLIANIKILWFNLVGCKKLRKKAHNRYRVIQTSATTFELQCYQNVQIVSYSGETGRPTYKWMPMIISPTPETRDRYMFECKKLRDSEYSRLVKEYMNNINKYKEPKYPKVIY